MKKRNKLFAYILAIACIVLGGLSLSSCKGEVFSSQRDFAFTLLPDGTYEISQGSTAPLKSITIPASHNGKPVTAIAKEGFQDCEMNSVTIPQSVTTLGDAAFGDCRSLTSVALTKSVTHIGKYAFAGCKKLKHLTLPDNLTEISANLFTNCEALQTVNIPQSVTKIGNEAFWGCTAFSEFIIPDHITDMGVNVFSINKNEMKFNEYEQMLYVGTAENPYYYLAGKNAKELTTVKIHSDCKIIGKMELLQGISFHTPLQLTIPRGVVKIANKAFANCDALQSVWLPASLTDYGEGAFYQCKNLTKAVFDDDTEEIPAYALTSVHGLKEVQFGQKLKKIGKYAFSACTGLPSVQIPDGVTEIGEKAFYWCESMTSVTLPQSLKKIGLDAFTDSKALTAIRYEGDIESWCHIEFDNLGANPLSITDNLFIDNARITEITIPESVQKINDYTFHNCKSLTSVTLPYSVTSIGVLAFENCENLQTINLSLFLTDIKFGAFRSCRNLTEISIPDGTHEIGSQAFYDCTALQTVRIPESIRSIGSEAFGNCKNLRSTAKQGLLYLGNETNPYVCLYSASKDIEEANVQAGCKIVTDDVFTQCYQLTTVVLPEGVLRLGHNFEQCINLQTIELPLSLVSVESVFDHTSDKLRYTAYNGAKYLGNQTNPYLYLLRISDELKTFEVPAQCKFIGNNALSNLKNLESVTLPEGLVYIGSNAFSNCTALKEIVIPATVEKISDSAFFKCSALQSVTLHEGLRSIGEKAFFECTALQSIIIPEGLTLLGKECFWSCTALTHASIPESLSVIPEYAFVNCFGLYSLSILGAERIEERAFSTTKSLTSVVLSDKLRYVGEFGFFSEKLRVIYYEGTPQSWQNISFANVGNFENVRRYYYSEMQPTAVGQFWHYVDGIPTPW